MKMISPDLSVSSLVFADIFFRKHKIPRLFPDFSPTFPRLFPDFSPTWQIKLQDFKMAETFVVKSRLILIYSVDWTDVYDAQRWTQNRTSKPLKYQRTYYRNASG